MYLYALAAVTGDYRGTGLKQYMFTLRVLGVRELNSRWNQVPLPVKTLRESISLAFASVRAVNLAFLGSWPFIPLQSLCIAFCFRGHVVLCLL